MENEYRNLFTAMSIFAFFKVIGVKFNEPVSIICVLLPFMIVMIANGYSLVKKYFKQTRRH